MVNANVVRNINWKYFLTSFEDDTKALPSILADLFLHYPTFPMMHLISIDLLWTHSHDDLASSWLKCLVRIWSKKKHVVVFNATDQCVALRSLPPVFSGGDNSRRLAAALTLEDERLAARLMPPDARRDAILITQR